MNGCVVLDSGVNECILCEVEGRSVHERESKGAMDSWEDASLHGHTKLYKRTRIKDIMRDGQETEFKDSGPSCHVHRQQIACRFSRAFTIREAV